MLVETVADAESFTPRNPQDLAFATQTTLSVDDTAEIVSVLQRRFPGIAAPHKDDICYATTNRQEAVRALAESADLVLVIGAPNSSNSLRLVEVAVRAGAPAGRLIGAAADLDWAWLSGVARVGVTAGASAPEDLVEELIAKIAERFDVSVEEVRVTDEDVVFKLPRALAE
jgi:4-hydroxy-3-methylbut-2-enyl diphosphate reductase